MEMLKFYKKKVKKFINLVINEIMYLFNFKVC